MGSITLEQLIWVIPIALLIIAVLQILYLLWMRLTFSPADRTPPRERSRAILPQVETSSQPPLSSGGAYASSYPSAPPSRPPSAPPSTPPSTHPSTAPVAAPVLAGTLKKFVVLGGLPDTGEMTLPDGDFGIGRYFNLEANILVAFDEKSISRKHATFLADDKNKEYHLIDTNSSYGTYVLIDNRFEALTPGISERIYSEDVIQFGNNVKVRVILPCETRASTTRV